MEQIVEIKLVEVNEKNFGFFWLKRFRIEKIYNLYSIKTFDSSF